MAFAALGLCSCGLARPFMVARANGLYADGFAHEAAALYLEAGAGSEPIASYDLANVFSYLGEKAPAIAMYEAAIAGADTGVIAMSWYNIGASAYAAGAYEEAAAAFRKALESYLDDDPGPARGGRQAGAARREMSRAYELALKAISDRKDSGAAERSRYGAGRPDGESRPLSLSRTDEKTLFAPGGAEAGAAEDH